MSPLVLKRMTSRIIRLNEVRQGMLFSTLTQIHFTKSMPEYFFSIKVVVSDARPQRVFLILDNILSNH